MQPSQAEHVAKCAAVAKREAAVEKREASLLKKEAAIVAAQALVKEADDEIKMAGKKQEAREKAAQEVRRALLQMHCCRYMFSKPALVDAFHPPSALR